MYDREILNELDNWMWEESGIARDRLKNSTAGLEEKGRLKGNSEAFLRARAKLFALRKGISGY